MHARKSSSQAAISPPGDERFPEGIEECAPGKSCVEVDAAWRKLPCKRQGGPYEAGGDNPGPRLLPGELREPVAGLCPNAHDEEEDVHGPVAIETCADGKDLADGHRGSSNDDGACKPCQP
jgi:hypothetical protein